MKRVQLLEKLHMNVPESATISLIIDTDAKNEADDQYAIIHHLLSPIIDVKGIVATHFEQKNLYQDGSMEKSYQEVVKLLELAEIEDVPALRGSEMPVKDNVDGVSSEGVRFIIEEARKLNENKLYIAMMGAMTDIAEKEAAAETLLASKGFSEAVVSLTQDAADVVVNAAELSDANRAQIEDIITRKTGVAAQNIVITPVYSEGK